LTQIKAGPGSAAAGWGDQRSGGTAPLIARKSSAAAWPPCCLLAKLRMFLVELFSLGRTASARYPVANSVPTSEANEDDQDRFDEAKHLQGPPIVRWTVQLVYAFPSSVSRISSGRNIATQAYALPPAVGARLQFQCCVSLSAC
jgi:hypothetical protein